MAADHEPDVGGVGQHPEPKSPMQATQGRRADGSQTPVRLVVCDDEIILLGLQAMLSEFADQVEILGGLRALDDILPMAVTLGADVVMVDIRPHGVTGMQGVGQLMAQGPPFRLVVFTHDDSERSLYEALRLGASGYLLKSLSGGQLAHQLVLVRGGHTVVDPTMASLVASRAALAGDGAQQWPGSGHGLSRRESEVLRLLADGLSNRLIAAELIVGEETVKTHLRSIYRKLEVKDRAQAVATSLRQGIFD